LSHDDLANDAMALAQRRVEAVDATACSLDFLAFGALRQRASPRHACLLSAYAICVTLG
jgi:NADH:ubiquinone oxidoreductase subunit B-like Fe-S oxidoreductase